MNESKILEQLLKLAQKSNQKNEVPVSAILTYKNKIIASAYNRKDHANSVLKHAELICIQKASKKLHNWRLDDCTLYVTLEPCPMCASAIQQARIKRVVYGAMSKNKKNRPIVDKIFNEIDANQKVEVTTGVLKDDCGKLISEFFKKKRV